MIIRPICPEDYDAWRPLWHGYLEFYETSVDDIVYDLTFDRLSASDHPNQCAFVAEMEGALVGLVHYIIHPHNWKVEDVIYLQDLFTHPDHRDQGIARALIEAVYRVADDNATPTVYWMTQEFNHTARRLYDKVANVTPFIKYTR